MAATGTGIGDVHAAIYGVLSTDATLLALATGGVTNHHMPGTTPAYPYVVIGDGQPSAKPRSRPNHTFGGAEVGLGRDIEAILHVWSDYRGDAEADAILSRILVLLDFKPLTVSGWSSASCECVDAFILRTDINKLQVRHGVAEFKVMVRQ